jgi:hypothetical protein
LLFRKNPDDGQSPKTQYLCVLQPLQSLRPLATIRKDVEQLIAAAVKMFLLNKIGPRNMFLNQ